jgi:hypothetical protein
MVSETDAINLPSHCSVTAFWPRALDVRDPAVQHLAFMQQGYAVHHQSTGETQRNVITGPGGCGTERLERCHR